MSEFINGIYEIENITTYISIAIGVLFVLFFIILFLGKKDQKLEETKKLQKLDMDAFKENSEALKIEIKKDEENINSDEEKTNIEEQVQNKEQEENKVLEKTSAPDEEEAEISLSNLAAPTDRIELPKLKIESNLDFEPLPEENNNEEKVPVIEEKQEENNFTFEDLVNQAVNDKTDNTVETKELEKEEFVEESPIVEETVNPFVSPATVFEPITKPEITEQPVVTFDDYNMSSILEEPKDEIIIAKADKTEAAKMTLGNTVFSSVYAPKKDEDIIDLTNLSKKPVEEKNEEIKFSDDEDLSKTLVNTSFDALLGESYDIKK